MKDSITLICKPTHECNMNCEYCYDKKEKNKIKNKYMTEEILEQLIKITLISYKNIAWIWHGGEATLMGKDFFLKAKKIFDKYKTENHNINFLIQSNGKNIENTYDWLYDLKIKPGYSYDILNDNKYRKEKTNIFNKINKDDGIISVVNEPNIDLNIFYEKYKDYKIAFNKIFFIENKEYDVNGFFENYKKLFDFILWNKNIQLERNISDWIKMICINRDVCCNSKQCLGSMIVCNPDGDLMICDSFSVDDKRYSLGNVKDYKEIKDCFSSVGFINAIKDDFIFRKNNCEKCNINMFCRNTCKTYRTLNNGIKDLTKQNKNECEFKKKIINYIFNVLFNLTRNDLEIINENVFKILFENKFVFKFIIDEIESDIK